MSTPTTAKATHPHYHYGGPFISHPQTYQSSTAGSTYQILPTPTRLAPYHHLQQQQPQQHQHQLPLQGYNNNSTPGLSSHTLSNGITLTASSSSSTTSPSSLGRETAHSVHSTYSVQTVQTAHTGHSTQTGQEYTNPIPRYKTNYTTSTRTTAVMPSTTTRTQVVEATPPPRKRRRSNGPDWDSFYKNGLPKEVIVIHDDTPDPDGQSIAGSSHTVTNGSLNGFVNSISTIPVNVNGRNHLAKKRKRGGEASATHYDPVHNRVVGSHTNTPATTHHIGSPSGSTVSSDRTNTAINTTAPTSLGSISSSGHYDDVQPGQKRKRTRQQQQAADKRREAALYGSAAYATYQPPSRPIKKSSEVAVRVVHEATPRNVKVDDDDGHYIVVPDADLTEDYQMIKLLGQGTFGKVVEARDRRRNELVAIKIIRSVQKYRDASRIELRVLQTLKLNDPENRNRCIHLRDTFDFRGHICIVMDLLGQSVFDFLKSNNFVPFPNSQIQSFARQLFTSVAFLHDLNLIHTDLKPENILLADANYQTFTYNRKIPSSSTTINRQATQRRVLLDTEIRLIDFGSATFQDEYHSSVVSTRHYRAPEIILGLGWSYPCDIWSIGCILVEFFTGDALFQTHDNLEHLAMMEVVCDGKIDTHLVQQMSRNTRNGGNPATKYFKRCRLDYPTAETTRASRRYVKAMKKLQDIIPTNNSFLKHFLDLLKKIFVYDPSRRITAKEALQHPWFREVANPDDGSEAARIRADRVRMNDFTVGRPAAHP